MAVPVDAITAALQGDVVITALATGGVHDRDLRRSNETLPVDANGDVLPLLMVDDTGGGRDPFSRASGVFSDRVMIWIFAPMHRLGRLAIEAITDRVLTVLHGWQDPLTGTVVMQGDRLGVQTTDAPDQSYMDRLTLKCQGVANVAW